MPDESASLEEIAEFWDTHSAADYEDAFEPVDVEFDIQQRHFEVEVKEDVFQALRRRSQQLRVPVKEILDTLLRNDLLPSRSS